MRKRLWTCWDDEEPVSLPTVEVFESNSLPQPLLLNAKGEPIVRIRNPIGFAMPSKR
jgi:hypothetical protein